MLEGPRRRLHRNALRELLHRARVRREDGQDAICQLAYRLYGLCERKGWAEEARAYNDLVTSWPAIVEESVKGSQLDLL